MHVWLLRNACCETRFLLLPVEMVWHRLCSTVFPYEVHNENEQMENFYTGGDVGRRGHNEQSGFSRDYNHNHDNDEQPKSCYSGTDPG